MQNESTKCSETFVRCDGGSADKGHPAVFLDLSKSGQAVCPYCGLTFFSSKGGSKE